MKLVRDPSANRSVMTVDGALATPVTLGVVLALLSGLVAILGFTYAEVNDAKDQLHELQLEHARLAERFAMIQESLEGTKRLLERQSSQAGSRGPDNLAATAPSSP